MRNSLQSIYLLLAISALAGCGKFDRLDDGGFTKVSFSKDGKSLTSATFNGGVLIYANSTGYSTNLKIADEDALASISLPNGVYTFYAFGFGSLNGFSSAAGDAICALTPATPLNGNAQNVSLTFTRANCADTGFFAASEHVLTASSYKYFRPVSAVACASSVSDANLGTKTPASDCFGTTWAAASSMRLTMPIYAGASGQAYTKLSTGYVSNCATGIFHVGSALDSNFRIPLGVAGATQRFPVEIEVFSDGSCTNKLATYLFNNGLAASPSSGAGVFRADTSAARIFLREPAP